MHISKRNYLIIFIASCYFNCTYGQLRQELEHSSLLDRIPPLFHESVLPATQRDGQLIEHLGHIVQLDTYLPPKQVDQYMTQFAVFNRRSKDEEAFIFKPKEYCIPGTCYGPYQYDLIGMANSGFDPNLKTIVMISGFQSGHKVDWMEEARDLWLRVEDVNVILIVWQREDELLYSRAVAETTLVARQITIFLHYLAELHGRKLIDESYVKDIHFVGFSLGAHVAAFVGQDLGGKMGRITGLDPAGPSFDQMARSRRLDPTDAQLVDIIHTNGGKIHYANLAVTGLATGAYTVLKSLPIIGRAASYVETKYSGEGDTGWFGIDAKLGHIDYYANDGRVQPGCSDIIHACDHRRSYDILVDILKHEVQLKQLQVDRSSNRLLAFRSDDYGAFISGQTFAGNCPALIDGDKFDSRSLNQCSAPIDLITSVDDLRSELRYSDNIDLEQSMNDQTGFYFSTNQARMLVGDQYLLKLGLTHGSLHHDNWDESCALQVELTMFNGVKFTEEFNKQLPLFSRGDFVGIAMPFVGGGLSGSGRLLLDKITNISSHEHIELLEQILPSRIQLSITGASSTGILEAATKKLANILTFGYAGQASEKCKLSFSSLEVIPIMADQRRVVAMYGDSGNSIRIARFAQRENLNLEGQRFQLSPSSKEGVMKSLNALMIE